MKWRSILKQLQRSMPSILLGVSLFLNAEPDCLAAGVDSAQQAIQIANRILGLEQADGKSSLSLESVEAIPFADSTTPFLEEYASNRIAWKVLFSQEPEVNSTLREKANSERPVFEVYIDSLSGTLLKVELKRQELDPLVDLEVSATEAEKQLLAANERYVGFPGTPPSTSLLQAMGGRERIPSSFRLMTAQYVLVEKMGRKARPAWVITLRGIPPLSMRKGGEWVPEYQRNRIRLVVDATIGKLIYSSTLPGPDLTPEDKERLFPHLRDSD